MAASRSMKHLLQHKELSWLGFNARVLQEAADPTVPLLERIRFLGIFSSNLDEFFRVRVATLHRLRELGSEAKSVLGYSPKEALAEVQTAVLDLNREFDRVYQDILKTLAREKVFILDEKKLTPEQGEFVRTFFHQEVRPKLIPIMLGHSGTFPEMRDQSIYLAVSLFGRTEGKPAQEHALIEIPSEGISRFLVLPYSGPERFIILLDDVIRYSLLDVFSLFRFERCDAYTVKLTRDAELDVDDDVSQSYIKKISRSLRHRKKGNPVRFIHDASLPKPFLRLFIEKLGLSDGDTIIAGGRYHNFKDFIRFPDFGLKHWKYPKTPALSHAELSVETGVMDAAEKHDLLFHYPYHSFDTLIDLLREASLDPRVESIKCTLYRLAKNSSLVNALINAVKNGKQVTAVVELQARFDEEANIAWANRMTEEGIHVLHGVPGLKVHAKLLLITRRTGRKEIQRFAVVGTGNFNENTAALYTDHSLFTTDPRITSEVEKVFDFIETNYHVKPFKHLLVSPFNMRHKIVKAIREEVAHAKVGRKAAIVFKLNNLTDAPTIKHLIKAGQEGVRVRLMVRGMFTLVPGVPGLTDHIEAAGIVDRYLEHTRVFWFHNDGDNRMWITSSDLMPRNLDGRVEVACPIYDASIQAELMEYLDLQWRDNVKTRILDDGFTNKRRPSDPPLIRAQEEIYRSLKKRSGGERKIEKTKPAETSPIFIHPAL